MSRGHWIKMATLFMSCVVVLAVLFGGTGVTDTSATTTVGVLKFWRYASYTSANIVIGHVILDDVKDLGTWSPECRFNATAGYGGRISAYNCINTTEGTRLRLELDRPTAQDGQGSYVCFNGALLPGARFNCSASYTTEEMITTPSQSISPAFTDVMPTTTPSPSAESPSHGGIIIGVVFGVLIAVILLSAGLYKLYRCLTRAPARGAPI